MTGREFGCKITMLLFAALSIFGFFGCLMNVTDTGLRAAILKKQQNDTRYDFQILFGGIKTYADAHQGHLPPMETPQAARTALAPPYVGFDDAFTRFGDETLHLPNPHLSNKLLAKLPPDAILYAEDAPKRTGSKVAIESSTRAVLQANGNVVRLTREEWEKRKF